MKLDPTTDTVILSAEDKARHKAIREKFQREKPTLEQLIASGEYEEPFLMGTYAATVSILAELKRVRQELGLSLSAVARKANIDKATLSKLENGRQPNPTMDTLQRYALALGKQVMLSLDSLEPSNAATRNGVAGRGKKAKKPVP